MTRHQRFVLAFLGLLLQGATAYWLGVRSGEKNCADEHDRREFALKVADAALGTAEVFNQVTLVAFARCRDKFPLPPMVPADIERDVLPAR